MRATQQPCQRLAWHLPAQTDQCRHRPRPGHAPVPGRCRDGAKRRHGIAPIAELLPGRPGV